MTVYVPGRDEKDLTKFALSLQQFASGRSNAVGSFTMATGAASTTITDANCAEGSTVMLTPTTANAATEFGAGSWYITASNGSFVVTHINSATAGRTFRYSILG